MKNEEAKAGMNADEFEKRLQRQTLRQVPAGWREEILAAANASQRQTAAIDRAFTSAATRRPWLSTLNHQLSTLLWPHPVAWAGLAAIWIFIFAVNTSTRDRSPMIVERASPPSPEVVVELKQQQRMLAELIGACDTHDADRPDLFVPQPRSERIEFLTT